MDMKDDELRIAIIGAGIAGLTLSRAIDVLSENSERKPRIDIYEGASNFTEIGAGINIWPRTWEIMQALGLSEKLVEFLPHVPDRIPRLVFEIRKADQAEGYHILDYMSEGGTIRLHRKALQKVLLSFQPENRVHLSHKLVSYEETEDDVRLYFADGTTTTCDLLVGADGIRSSVRRRFLEYWKTERDNEAVPQEGFHRGDPVWTGTYAYRGLVPFEKLDARLRGHRAITTPMMYTGRLRHIICYPLPYNGAVNVVAQSTDPSKENTIHPLPTTMQCDKEEVRALFKNWEIEVETLIESIENPSKWALMALVPLEHYARRRVLLMGDAAHGMTPHQGAGAGQAFDDAYVLGALLAHPQITSKNIPQVSEVYDRIRCPAANRVLRLARQAGLTTELIGEEFDRVPNLFADVKTEEGKAVFDITHDEFEGMIRDWDWVWCTSAEDDRQEALASLNAKISSDKAEPLN